MNKNLLLSIGTVVITVVAMPGIALAHVIVTPNQAGIGQELTFNISVPNERQTPVVSLKLDIPSGVTNVVPTVETGWTIQPTGNNSSADPEITALAWTGGSIPVGQREDFSFSAQLPASVSQLDWKAYQTYADGTVVHWDQKPVGSDDATGNAGPYSVTKVVNDLQTASSSHTSTLPLILSIIALVLSAGALFIRKK